MRSAPLVVLASLLALAGCSTQQVVDQTPPSAPKPLLIDEYAALDDRQSAPSLSDETIKKRMDLARAHYLKALKLIEKNDQKTAAKHFEASISILNDLITHPEIEELADYSRLSQSVIRDYESKITSIDALDSNSSFFVLREKMFQEIDLLPVSWRPATASTTKATAKISDTLRIALPDNEAVQKTLDFFTIGKGRKSMATWLARSGRFFPMYERILAEEGAPDELKYLSMIESGLNPTVTSKAKAVGLWQFISSTGRAYGMHSDWYVDERRDPEKATRAAARYLMDLYEEMGDWHLALGSYNCGPGRMRRALRKSDSVDYWEARNYLPQETRLYVPLYVAAAKIARDPAAYGFTDIVLEKPDEYESTEVRGSYSLTTLSAAAGCSVDELRRLNPELLQDRIPPDELGYQLRVPTGTSTRMMIALDTMTSAIEPEVSMIKHTVKSGESLTRIAANYGVSVDEIMKANGMTSANRLLKGKKLTIPVRNGSASDDGNDVAANKESSSTSKSSKGSTEELASINDVPASATRSVLKSVPSTTTKDAPKETATRSTGKTEKHVDLTASIALNDAPTAERKASQGTMKEILKESAAAPAEPVVATEPVDAGPVFAAVDAPQTGEKTIAAAAERTAPVAATPKKATAITHKVKRGETLTGIAQKYGVTIAKVKSWNSRGITEKDDVLLGATLKIYPATESSSKNDATVATTTPRTTEKKSAKTNGGATSTESITQVSRYKVRRGETLTEIAVRFNVTLRELQKTNPQIDPNSLQAGQVIRIR